VKWGRLKNLKRRLGFFASLRMTEGLEITASGCSAEIVAESPALGRRVRVARPPATSKSSTLASDRICTTSNATSYPQGVAGTGTYLSQVVTNTARALWSEAFFHPLRATRPTRLPAGCYLERRLMGPQAGSVPGFDAGPPLLTAQYDELEMHGPPGWRWGALKRLPTGIRYGLGFVNDRHLYPRWCVCD
jgi:hypothetical protein